MDTLPNPPSDSTSPPSSKAASKETEISGQPQDKLNGIIKALDMFSKAKTSCNESQDEDPISKTVYQYTDQTAALKIILDEALKEGSSAEFTSLKQQMESLQDSIGQEPLFIKFVLDRFWSQMNSTPTQHESAPTSHSEAPSQDLAACLSQIDKLNEELKQRDACIEQLENTNRELETTVEELKAQVAGGSQENALAASYAESGVEGEQTEEPSTSYEDLARIYSENTGDGGKFGANTLLCINFSQRNNRKFAKALQQRMPPLAMLQMECLPSGKKQEVVKTFMRDHFPVSLKKLGFNLMSEKLMSITPFMDELALVWHRVTESVSIANFEINQQELVTILYYNKHREKLGFNFCKLDLSSAPNFGNFLDGSTLQDLDLMD